MDNIQIHIWQLSEKTDSIDSNNTLVMVHDKYALKKTTIRKLFDYLNQDYKIESTIAYFDNQMKNINDQYTVFYSTLEVSISEFDQIIEELTNKFNTNRDKIRSMETDMNRMYTTLISIDKDLKLSDSDLSILSETLTNFGTVLTNLNNELNSTTLTLDDYKTEVKELSDEYSRIDSNTLTIQSDIETVKEVINNHNSDKSNELLQKINSEYDKLITIIDYYHHIHE